MPRFSCLWFSDFAAWAAQQSDPLLQGKPVLAYQGGYIIAVSPEARAVGAQVGWTLHRAQAQLQPQLPEVVFWPLHGPTIQAMWSQVIADLLDFTPYLESRKPGLLLMDVRPPRSVLPLVREWQAHCGVADDHATAELAAFTTAAGTLRAVRPDQSATFLKRVPLSALSAAGLRADTLQRLNWFGWQNVGHISTLTKRQLHAQFDQADLLFHYAQANETRPVSFYRQPPAVSSSFTFETPVREPYEWQTVLDLLIEQTHAALQERGAQTISVQISTGSGVRRSHRLLPGLTSERRPFYEIAHSLLIDLLRACQPMQQLTVQLGALSALPPTQTRLFGRARPSINIAVQALEERFPGALCHIVMLDKNAYLPEVAFRLEPITLEALLEAQRSTSKRSSSKRNSAKLGGSKRHSSKRQPSTNPVPVTLELAL